MSGTGIRIVDMPDLGSVTDLASFVGEKSGSGRFTAPAVRDYLAGLVASVRLYGAAGDGVANDTAAINAALATGRPVYFPPGTYNTTGGHTLATNGQVVFGISADQCIVQCTVDNATIFSTGAGTTGVTYRDLKLTRSVTAVNGGNGIDARATHARGLIENLAIEKQWIGALLGATDISVMRRCAVYQNLSNGVLVQNSGIDTALQWTLDTVLSQWNVGHGFAAQSNPFAGAVGISLGEWINLSTYGNSGAGMAILGTAGIPIHNLRIHGGFLGSDGGNAELYMDSYGKGHAIHNIWIEGGGLFDTGPSLTTPPSNATHGVQITTNNRDIQIVGIKVSGNSQAGIVTSAVETLLSGCSVVDNGRTVGGVRYGIGLLDGRSMVSGCRVGNTGGDTTQLYGIHVADGSQTGIVGNDLNYNTNAPLELIGSAGRIVLIGNIPAPNVNTRIPDGSVAIGQAIGGESIIGGLNVAGGIAKNNTPYNNP